MLGPCFGAKRLTKLTNPIPLFLDGRGALLDGGYVWVGTVNLDPEVPANQLPLFTDKAQTDAIAQPLRTLGGVIVDGLNLAEIYFAATDFSITVRDADLNLVYFKPSGFDLAGTSYQPLDSDLTAIAALATTAFGRGVLTLADAAALRALAILGDASLLNEASTSDYRASIANKVLTSDVVWSAAIPVVIPYAASITLDLNAGINFKINPLTGGCALENPINAKPGQSGFIEIQQDGTGNRVMTFGTSWTGANGTDPVLSTPPNTKDVLEYQVMSDGTLLCSLIKARS